MILFFIISKWPKYWEHINYEYSHLTWLSSVNLIITGLVCILSFLLTELSNPVKEITQRYIMGFLGVGFIFLSLDEKFQIHEKLRENFFIPNEIGTNISGIGAGDFLHILIAIFGLAISRFIYIKIKKSKLSIILFTSALTLAFISVITDATSPVVRDDSLLSQSELMRSINHQFTEEILETTAVIFFGSCFINYFFIELENLISTEDI
tara:strand:- start:63731 stop:64357 length:627 start_codon:yes stop_codon:yes gene_type:complete